MSEVISATPARPAGGLTPAECARLSAQLEALDERIGRLEDQRTAELAGGAR
jgi:hypothetical protein